MVRSRTASRGFGRALVGIVSVLAGFGVSLASTVLPANVEELYDGAERIVVGTVVSSNPEPPAIVTKLRVEETLKGPATKELKFRQLGRTGPGGRFVIFPGLPRFSEGEHVVLFLPKPSDVGFSSPVALGHGTFRVQKGGKEDGLLFNESRNLTLFNGLKSARTTRLASTLAARTTPEHPGVSLHLSDLKALLTSYKGSSK